MKRQEHEVTTSLKRKKRRGRRKSKAERLARLNPVSSSADDLVKLLEGTSSRDWDAAQSLALRIGTPDAGATVVRVILVEREAPRAAAHYAKRLNLRGEELLNAVSPGSTISPSPLLLAQFLVELDEDSLSTGEKLEWFLWPWLLHSMEKKDERTAAKAAVHLILHPTAVNDAKVQDKRERGRRLERALVAKCLQTGNLLYLVPTHARAFVDRISVGSPAGFDEEKVDPDASEIMKEVQRRQQVARRVQNVIRLLWPDARVLVFGSSVTGLLPRSGKEELNPADVDLCALLPSAPQFRQETAPLITEMKEHLALYLLPDTTKETEHVAAVTGARVPIVHFRDPSTKLPCDLCVNNVPALWNTRLLRWLLYVKKRVVSGALSSYGLMLLAIYYLQRVSILPVLDCSTHAVEDEPSLRTLTEEEIDRSLEVADKTSVCVKEQAGDVVTSCSGSGNLGKQCSAREAREAERLVKLQHFLLLRAFNLRRPKETLHEQFQFLKKRVESTDPRVRRDFLELDELCAYLSIPPYRRLLLVQVFGLAPQQTQLGFDDFIRFLQSAAVRAAREERQQHLESLPTPPPRTPRLRQTNDLVSFGPSRMNQEVTRAPPAPGLWKKREVTIQERITEYTKIDDKGQPQRLVEKERHQTEVLHMESLDGEFAHREITQFEQTEHLNDEMVHLDHGREEFLHLKSRHDEISRFESSVPPGGPSGGGRPEECEQQPPSPTIKRDPSAPGTARESTGFDHGSNAEAEGAPYVEADIRRRWDQQAPEKDVQQT
ncbi:hypothetical protein JG688_00002266 [Phytophthora aleatoria]|uniref:Poly(A) RNA polymerase mitochondrial-like central palm domain-containing protein n=1 Tax=Phytophthora aleatoria TaxID=2496075 RepID=A0A8J5J534_9STRA|nr:hypothetical protein JG688_00002266 [Phytophthora aleatoria]